MTPKILIIGASGVGKTAMLKRIITGEWTKEHVASSEGESYTLTLGVRYLNFECTNKIQNLDAYDGVIWMFDLTNPDSFEFIRENYKPSGNDVIVANKYDLLEEYDVSSELKYHQFCSEHGLSFCLTSYKSCFNFDKPFSKLGFSIDEME